MMKRSQSSSQATARVGFYARTHGQLVVAAVTMLAVADAFGATLHVAVSGDDAAAGTPEAPLRTIQKAVAIARAGDTIIVHGGEYSGLTKARPSIAVLGLTPRTVRT
jgi:hypothetical protein